MVRIDSAIPVESETQFCSRIKSNLGGTITACFYGTMFEIWYDRKYLQIERPSASSDFPKLVSFFAEKGLKGEKKVASFIAELSPGLTSNFNTRINSFVNMALCVTYFRLDSFLPT